MVEGTIVVEENRSVIDKFRFWYKENIIDRIFSKFCLGK